MRIKALIQSHYPERLANLGIMTNDLIKNGIQPEDIIFLLDYGQSFKTDCKVMLTNQNMPINWWHGIASVLDCDYVALLCDDLTLLPDSIESLKYYALAFPEIDVFGFEGGNLAKPPHAYKDSKSHAVESFEEAKYVIRFYFAKPKAFANALSFYHLMPKSEGIHDDLILSLSNKCGIVPISETVGWKELNESEVGYSRRPTHYQERDELCNKFSK